MATENKKEEAVQPNAAEIKAVKATRNATKEELATKDYVLTRNVMIGDKSYKKGDSYPLTENGRKYFKSLNYIK